MGSQGATSMFGWNGIREAAVNTAVSPMRLVRAAGALAFQAGRADQKVSNWASNTTPVYSSQKNAGRVSDILLQSSGGASDASDLTVPTTAMGTALVAEAVSGISLRQFDGIVKKEAGRTRHNGMGNLTFSPSLSAGTALDSTPIYRNSEYLNLSSAASPVSQISFVGMTAATTQARVETMPHYPTDVLVGAAIGHFFGVFITDAFLAGPVTPTSIITPETADLERVGLLVSLHWSF